MKENRFKTNATAPMDLSKDYYESLEEEEKK